MNIKPLSNHVLVAPVEDEAKQTKSGIVLPDTADKKKQSKGTVVAVGPGQNERDGRPRADVGHGRPDGAF